MKTTIDLPEDILIQAKVTAAKRRTTLKDLVISGLRIEMGLPKQSEDDTEAFVAAFSRGNNIEHPIGKISRDAIHDRSILH